MQSRLVALGLLVVPHGPQPATQQTVPVAPVVSVWYRGSPAGTPRLDDLAAIRALGLTGITWPSNQGAALADVRRLAEIVGLAVVARPEPKPVAGPHAAPVVGPDSAVDLRVAGSGAVA